MSPSAGGLRALFHPRSIALIGVALKVGRSDTARHTAQAHTGALVGDDAVMDAAFRQLGVVRVRSLEALDALITWRG